MDNNNKPDLIEWLNVSRNGRDIQIFVLFLLFHGIHDKFINNYHTSGEDYPYDFRSYIEEAINYAFEWVKTPERYNFWDYYNRLWKATLNDIRGKRIRRTEGIMIVIMKIASKYCT